MSNGKRLRQPLGNRLLPWVDRQPTRAKLRPRKLSGPDPLLSRWTWARDGATLSVGVCSQGQSSHPIPKTTPHHVTMATKVLQVTATAKEVTPENIKPKNTAGPKNAAVKPKKASSTGAKPVTTPKPVANPAPTSPIDEISDVFDSLPNQSCVQLTRRLLASISSLPKGAPPSQAKPSKVLTEGRDMREAQVDVPPSGSHTCV